MWDEPVNATGANEPANAMPGVATGEGQAAVFIAIDHRAAECAGIHASSAATRHEALEPIRQALPEFQQTCNTLWPIERQCHRPPAAIRRAQTMNTRQAAWARADVSKP